MSCRGVEAGAVMGEPRNVLFFDFETTGVDVEKCGVVQGAAQLVRYSGDGERAVVGAQEFGPALCDPGVSIEPEASQHNRLVDADVAGEPPPSEALAPLAEMAKYAHYLCGHNARFFDAPIAARVLSPTFAEKPVIDTLRMSRRYAPQLPEHRLGALAYRYELFDLSDRELRFSVHDAGFDVRLCRGLFEFLWPRVDDPPCPDVDSLHAWHLSVKPAARFSFGKHKGELIADVVRENPDIVEWYLRQEWFAEKFPDDRAGVLEVTGRG